MKRLFIAAMAFSFAVPAAAQPAQPMPSHQGHQMPAVAGSGGQVSGQGQQAPAGPPMNHGQMDHSRMVDHSRMANCCGDAKGNGKMDCCENMGAAGERPCCAEHAQQQAQPSGTPQAHNQ